MGRLFVITDDGDYGTLQYCFFNYALGIPHVLLIWCAAWCMLEIFQLRMVQPMKHFVDNVAVLGIIPSLTSVLGPKVKSRE